VGKKSKRLEKRLGELEAAVGKLTVHLHAVARFSGRIDENVEELGERVKDLTASNAEVSGTSSTRTLERLQRQTAELRREQRSRILPAS
jgi:archaellum component FlaC